MRGTKVEALTLDTLSSVLHTRSSQHVKSLKNTLFKQVTFEDRNRKFIPQRVLCDRNEDIKCVSPGEDLYLFSLAPALFLSIGFVVLTF